MARDRSVYRCQTCGFASSKPGTCPDCARVGGFAALVEERVSTPGARRRAPASGPGGVAAQRPVPLAEIRVEAGDRTSTGIGELDRVLGGGVVKGSLVLIGGDPGIGKSTILLGASRALAERMGPVLYVSGEESAGQVKMRADRLGISARRALLPRRDRSARHRGARGRARAAGARGGLDPDHVPARSRVRARQRGAGAGVRRPAHDAGQVARARHVPRRPRHQGGRARGAARARAPGGHRALLRGRAPPRLSRAARGEEPLRLHQRDRRLRDGGERGCSRSRTRPGCSCPSGPRASRAR